MKICGWISLFSFLCALYDFPTESALEATPRGASGGLADVPLAGAVNFSLLV